MSGKFDNVPVEQGTEIRFQLEAKWGEWDVLYQRWCWDGIDAESLIFVDEDIANLSDDQIEMEMRASPLLKKNSSVTIKRSVSGFTFVNFNFETGSSETIGG